MICDNCKVDRLEDDFIKTQKFCYHCEYQKKKEKTVKKQKRSRIFCRICNEELIPIENLKKRQRTIFCSEDCALKGQRLLTSTYWMRCINSRKGNGI